MSDPVRVQLKHPIQVGSERVDALTFRRPKAKDLKGIEISWGDDGIKLDLGDLVKLAGRTSGQTDAVIGELDIEDMQEVGAIVLGFIGRSQETGEKPSQS